MESDNQVTKVAFLFGAGAEVDGGNKNTKNYGICSGYEYITKAFPDKETFSGQGSGLKSKFSKKKYFKDGWAYRKNYLSLWADANTSTDQKYSSFAKKVAKRLIAQKISYDGADRFEEHREILQGIFTEDEASQLGLYKKSDNNKGDTDKWNHNTELCSDYDELCDVIIKEKKCYSEIQSGFVKRIIGESPSDENKEIVVNYTRGAAGILDEYFHTIVDPPRLGRDRFAMVFNYYWACYFAILNDVLRWLLGSEENNEYFRGIKVLKQVNSQSGLKLDHIEILRNIQKLTEYLYDPNLPLRQKNSYYDLISNELNKKTTELTCAGVATTNYYRFCEVVHGAPIYLNGSLNLFEFPETLEVLDAKDDSDGSNDVDLSGDKLFFPFLFGQSMVKPVVHSKQTEEFHRFKKMLDEANVLVVLGYGINEDDNHINAFLHEFLMQPEKRLICVSEKKKADIMRKLRFPADENSEVGKRITCITYEGGNKKTVEELFKQIRTKTKSEDETDAAVAAGNIASEKRRS